MSLLSYFLSATNVPEKFESVEKYITVNKIKIVHAQIDDLAKAESFELGHKIYKQDGFVMYETILSNGEKIVRNHLSKHDTKGNLLELLTYFGDNNKYDDTTDVCYLVDLINDNLCTEGPFWDEINVNPDDNLNFSVQDFTPGFLISKNQSYNPKKIQVNGKVILDILGTDLEICYVDYLKYESMNVTIYCTKYDIEEEINNNFNKIASDIAKRKIVGHCIMTSNENLDETTMAKVVLHAMNFNQKKYEDNHKKELLKMYAKAYVIQNPK